MSLKYLSCLLLYEETSQNNVATILRGTDYFFIQFKSKIVLHKYLYYLIYYLYHLYHLTFSRTKLHHFAEHALFIIKLHRYVIIINIFLPYTFFKSIDIFLNFIKN